MIALHAAAAHLRLNVGVTVFDMRIRRDHLDAAVSAQRLCGETSTSNPPPPPKTAPVADNGSDLRDRTREVEGNDKKLPVSSGTYTTCSSGSSS